MDFMTVASGVLMVIGGASIVAAAVAPLTKTDVDNKVAKVLKKVHAFLSKYVALNPKGE